MLIFHRVPLASRTLTDQQVLSGRSEGAPEAVLAAELRQPAVRLLEKTLLSKK